MASFYYPPKGGGSGGVDSLNGLTGDLTLAPGANITITPSGGNTLTIAAPGSAPAGATGDVQFNVGGAFAADTGKFIYDPTTGISVHGAGTNSERYGQGSIAASQESTALGYHASAGASGSNPYTTAVGAGATAEIQGSIAVGRGAQATNGTANIAIGQDAGATGSGASLTIGYAATNSGSQSTVIGFGAGVDSSTLSVAIGSQSSIAASADASTAIGYQANVGVGATSATSIGPGAANAAGATYGFAIGPSTTNTGPSAGFAMGYNAVNDATVGMSIGAFSRNYSTGTNGMAIGYASQNRYVASVALGQQAITSEDFQFLTAMRSFYLGYVSVPDPYDARFHVPDAPNGDNENSDKGASSLNMQMGAGNGMGAGGHFRVFTAQAGAESNYFNNGRGVRQDTYPDGKTIFSGAGTPQLPVTDFTLAATNYSPTVGFSTSLPPPFVYTIYAYNNSGAIYYSPGNQLTVTWDATDTNVSFDFSWSAVTEATGYLLTRVATNDTGDYPLQAQDLGNVTSFTDDATAPFADSTIVLPQESASAYTVTLANASGGYELSLNGDSDTGAHRLKLAGAALDFGNTGGVGVYLQKQGYNGIGLTGGDGASFYLNANNLYGNDGSGSGGGTWDMEGGSLDKVNQIQFNDSTTMTTAPSSAFTQTSSNTSAGGSPTAPMPGSKNTIGGTIAGSQLGLGGNDNTFWGYEAGYSTAGGGTGDGNTFIGSLAGNPNTSGSYNTGLGYNAGGANNSTGSYNIWIGYDAYPLNSAFNNSWAIGKSALVNASNTAALGAASDPVRFGLNMSTASAWLHLPAGLATAGFAPLKFTSGTLLSTPEAGAVEFDGTHFYITIGSTRTQIPTSAGSGTVTSVALSVPATSIFGVSGSPVTTSGTLGLTTTGTSGGIPYFSSTSQIASSALLTNHAIVLGGGAAAAPTVLGSLGTTTTVLHGNASGDPSFGAVSLTADVSGTLPIANGGTNNGSLSVTGGTVYYGDGSKIVGLANGSSGQFLKSNGTTVAPSWASPTFTAPTVQIFTSGTGTYTTPAGVLYIQVEVVGGGGGGGAGGTNNGTNGNNSTFSVHSGAAIITCNGGGGGSHDNGGGLGQGGAFTISTSGTILQVLAAHGGDGSQCPTGANPAGGTGAVSFLGGSGAGGNSNGATGQAGTAGYTNTGSGGGGGSQTGSGGAGQGGGAGAYAKVWFTSPSASYDYAVGGTANGGAGNGTTSGAGGNGAAGQIIVTEYYQ